VKVDGMHICDEVVYVYSLSKTMGTGVVSNIKKIRLLQTGQCRFRRENKIVTGRGCKDF